MHRRTSAVDASSGTRAICTRCALNVVAIVTLCRVKSLCVFFGDFLGLSRGWEKGTEDTLFRVPLRDDGMVIFGTPICFEDAFPNLCRRFIFRGADLLINLTNVAWSRRRSAEIQMHVAALFRSIENRRILVRATNAGVTSVIGPKGEIL